MLQKPYKPYTCDRFLLKFTEIFMYTMGYIPYFVSVHLRQALYLYVFKYSQAAHRVPPIPLHPILTVEVSFDEYFK